MNNPPWPWLLDAPHRPWCIAHRGFSDRAFDNSLQAFDLAAAAGADFWEVDVRTTCDGELVAWHDATLKKLGLPDSRVEELTCAGFLKACAAAGRPMPRLHDVIERALSSGSGLYIDAKDRHALDAAPECMARMGVERGIIASFDARALAELGDSGCAYPRSILVRRGGDPIACALAADARLLHLCWEWADVPAIELISSGLLAQAEQHGLHTVLWHEERPLVLQQLLRIRVRGICTNDPERMLAGRSDRR